MEKINIAILGCGDIASSHVNGYKDLNGRGLRVFNIKAVCDSVKEKAETKFEMISGFQEKKPNIYTDFEVMLKEESLDALDICSPMNTHHVAASKCFEKGLHVIVEKPLGITMRAAKKIIGNAEKYGKKLAVAENYRRSPQNRAVRWAIKEGLIGTPRVIFWSVVLRWGPNPWGWREDKLVAGAGWMFDGGVHYADLDRYQLGIEALQVYSVNKTYEPLKKDVKITVDDMNMAIIQYNNEVYGQWFCSKSCPGKDMDERIIYGSKGCLTREELLVQKEDSVEKFITKILVGKMMRSLNPEEKEKWFPKGATDTFAIELYDFYNSIINKKKPEVDGEEAYKDMAIPLSFYESFMLNKPVKIKDVEDLKVEEYQKEINEKLAI